jgi:hypothetical protein
MKKENLKKEYSPKTNKAHNAKVREKQNYDQSFRECRLVQLKFTSVAVEE